MQHGSWIKRGFWPLLQRPALNRAHCFHATSEAEYQAIRELEFRQPVAIIPNGIDVHQLPPRTASPWRTLLFLGRLHVVKGIDTLLAAWGRVQPKFLDWRLVIVGSDDGYHGPSGYLADLKNYATQLGLQRVTFAGALFGAAKLQTLRDADLYVLPSRSENFAVSVAEALSMGTPAIVSTGAPWSGLEEKRAGWWIAPNVETLADCLCDAMACSPAELDAMGARGRSWMESDFSWASVAAQMAETYAWLRARVGPTPAWVRID
jgi:glycosyltransferase involved in cell wall biosynthesis